MVCATSVLLTRERFFSAIFSLVCRLHYVHRGSDQVFLATPEVCFLEARTASHVYPPLDPGPSSSLQTRGLPSF